MAMIGCWGWETGSYKDNSLDAGYLGIATDVTAGPWSRYSLSFNNANFSYNTLALDASVSELYYHEHFRGFGTLSNLQGVEFRSPNNTVQVMLCSNAGYLQAVRGTSIGTNVLGTSSTITAADSTWHCLEAHLKVATGTSGIIECWLEGVLVIQNTACNTQNDGSSSNVDRITPRNQNFGDRRDDIVVFDTSGSANNGRIHCVAVFGERGDSAGDTDEWDPMEATNARFYFPRVTSLGGGGYESSPLPTLTPSSSWTSTANAYTSPLHAAKRVVSGSYTATNATNAWAHPGSTQTNGLLGQFVSEPIAAQTISGTFKCYLKATEGNGNFDLAAQIIIRVVSGDGTTVRGTLYAGDTTTSLSNEWTVSTYTNRAFPRGNTGSGQTMTSVGASDGDRIVVEVGARCFAAGAQSVTYGIAIGSGDSTDNPEDETTTSGAAGWIEFSSAITMSGTGAWELTADRNYYAIPDDDLSYRQTDTRSDNRFLDNFEDVGATYGDVYAVAVKVRAKKEDPGDRNIAVLTKDNATIYAGSDQALPLDYTVVHEYYDARPSSTAWDRTSLNALQAGAKAR